VHICKYVIGYWDHHALGVALSVQDGWLQPQTFHAGHVFYGDLQFNINIADYHHLMGGGGGLFSKELHGSHVGRVCDELQWLHNLHISCKKENKLQPDINVLGYIFYTS